MNALQRLALRNDKNFGSPTKPVPPPHCTACGEPLDGHQHEWCDHSTSGFHVKPIANL